MENTDVLSASLQEIGLTEDQAKVYRTLLELGPSKAFKIAFNSGVKRALTYKILDQLEEMGLVTSVETEEDKVTTFSPVHPSKLEELINLKRKNVADAENSLNSIIQTLTSSYNLANKKPNVQFFEGEKGVKYVYDDILRQKCDILIFRSYLDNTNESVSKIIDELRDRQRRLGLKVRLISSKKPTQEIVKRDKENNVSRKYLEEEKFSLPAQISVYGDKVAIISYKDPIITTVIENSEIRTAFAILFELVWSQAVAPENLLTK